MSFSICRLIDRSVGRSVVWFNRLLSTLHQIFALCSVRTPFTRFTKRNQRAISNIYRQIKEKQRSNIICITVRRLTTLLHTVCAITSVIEILYCVCFFFACISTQWEYYARAFTFLKKDREREKERMSTEFLLSHVFCRSYLLFFF